MLFKNKLLCLYLFFTSMVLFASKIDLIDTIQIDFTFEPSGITYVSDTDSFYIVGDEGNLYEIDKNAQLIRSVRLGDFDLESITYNKNKKLLYCLEEKSISMLEIRVTDFKILNIIPLKILKAKKRIQFESLLYISSDKENGDEFFIGSSIKNKAKNKGVLTSFILKDKKVTFNKEFEIPVWDIAGLGLYNNTIYIVSDREDRIAMFDLTLETLIGKSKITGAHQEGIILDPSGIMYIVDEIKLIYKYSFSDLNNGIL